jgi:hypothetical protein
VRRFSGFLFSAVFLLAVIAPLGAHAQTACIGHRPQYIEGVFEPWYNAGCTGHDEPELDPVSSAPGSARDLTWTAVLPTDGTSLVSDVGPTFWFGGAVTDPKSLFGQAFLELQFYPDSIVNKCGNNGSFTVSFAPNMYSACSPVWKINPNNSNASGVEVAAFNAMLEDSLTPGSALIMHAGDTITIHFYVTAAQDGFHITVTDLNTGHTGTIILNSQSDGPLMPAFDTQAIGNSLAWGGVYDTPNSFVWEIGHESIFNGGAAFCVPGEANCDSYDAAHWAGFGSPLQILSVTFGDHSSPTSWAVVSDLGGKAEVTSSRSQCGGAYGGPLCIYPWYTLGSSGFHYGVDYPDTIRDFRKADQFATTRQCGGPFGPNTTYCATTIVK